MSNSTKNILSGLCSKMPVKKEVRSQETPYEGLDNTPELAPAAAPALSMSAILANCLTRKDEFSLTPPA